LFGLWRRQQQAQSNQTPPAELISANLVAIKGNIHVISKNKKQKHTGMNK
jgi:hypothetical protein